MSVKPPIKRQAVVVIHGIGEQRPMDTLRDFASSVAPKNQDPSKPSYFSKPDQFSDNHETRRLAAHQQIGTHKTDYFELYWAHLMLGTKISDVIWWVWNIFVRLPHRVPQRLRWIYWTFWSTLIITVGLLVYINFIANSAPDSSSISWITTGPGKAITSLILALVSTLINGLLINYLGDAVRYFTPRPGNIAQRQQIRSAGIDLLKRLHDQKDSKGKNVYDRIIIVGHSLGSVIAYDILSLYWNKVSPKLELDPNDIDRAEKAIADLKNKKMTIEQYRSHQLQFWLSQNQSPDSWRISDLLTLGSPLAFADFYLAKNTEEFEQKVRQREFPTCPPVTEPPSYKEAGKLRDPSKTEWISFPASDDPSVPRRLHHAAVFSMVRFTNLYFENDYVGGPIECLGNKIENKRFTSRKYGWFPFISHTQYWNKKEDESLACLIEKLDLFL